MKVRANFRRATLLLAHSPSQEVNQQRLESYIARSSEPMLDFSDRLETSSQYSTDYPTTPSHITGTNTPRDLNSRLKVVELYALHVLPRNEDWECAQEFLANNELLDEDRRETFLQILQSLKDQKQEEDDRGAELGIAQEENLKQEHIVSKDGQIKEKSRAIPEDVGLTAQHKRSGSEIDYGIEEQSPGRSSKKLQQKANTPKQSQTSSSAKFSPISRRSQGTRRSPNNNYKRGITVINLFHDLVNRFAQSMANNPGSLLRMLLFFVTLLLALGRRDTRTWLARMTGFGFDRLKRTIGMGVKVSYV